MWRPRRPASLAVRIGVGCCGALAGLVAFSLVCSIAYDAPALYLSLDRGTLFFSTRPNARPDGWSVTLSRTAPRFLMNAFPAFAPRAVQPYWRGWIPLWTPLLALALGTGGLWWWQQRPYPRGRCPACGYDLTGNTTGRCPECGRAR